MINQKIDPEAKAIWIAALRSGHYEQGQELLRSGDNYCCLGVFCEVMGVPSYEQAGLFIYGDSESVLSDEVQDQYGFDSSEVMIQLTENNVEAIKPFMSDEQDISFLKNGVYLTSLNDFGVPFNVIADLIEEHL
jgi:hypothetical protein